MLTVLDGYCGAGGSSSGAEMVPGVRVKYALNHWDKAIATHNHNMPHVDHDRIDMTDDADGDPRKYAATDIGWFSPECTTWSVARGEKRDYDAKALQGDLFADDEPEADEAKQRSRFGMWTVPKFAAFHNYKAVIVENVTDILAWWDLDTWLAQMATLGYQHRIVVLNSAFAHHLGAPAPQLRDRVYFVFWKTCYRTPDFAKWTRPNAWCPTCERVVRAIYVDKQPGRRRAMRYGQQYVYRCPTTSCRGALVHPYVLAAASAIDWTLPAERIGDRVKPLQPKTIARIEAGLRRYARPITLEAAGNTFERRPGVRTWSAQDWPLTAQTTTATKALACPPMLVPAGGTWNDGASSADEPMRARTTRETEGVVVPPFLAPLRSDRPRTSPVSEPLATVVANGSNHALIDPLLVSTTGRDGLKVKPVSEPAVTQTARHEMALVVPLRNNGVARPAVEWPTQTFAANGTHHALVMRNNEGGAEMSTPVTEPIRTLTTKGHQSLVQWGNHAIYGYDTGHLRPLGLPLPTQTTVQGDALLGRAVEVDQCTFRMLDVHEIKAGMAFAARFEMPIGAKRDKVKMLGNAVTPPAARDLIAAVVEAITGDEIRLTA
ncbi:DNA cytosine methyltransferase [Dactylosporangium sp. NPDC000244]|uniref:DNA cytosine methyltransferase n=1 Tax=Dactylosporangium sp. NPDC000244 TaxID=3154365 RepID=UPI003326FF1A